jgi:hypothetical protein
MFSPSIVTPLAGVLSLMVSTLGVTKVGVVANTALPVPVSSDKVAANCALVRAVQALVPVPLPNNKVLAVGVLAPMPTLASISFYSVIGVCMLGGMRRAISIIASTRVAKRI